MQKKELNTQPSSLLKYIVIRWDIGKVVRGYYISGKIYTKGM